MTLMSLEAIPSLVFLRCCISPAILWAKNSIGRCRTFHMYVVAPIDENLPSILRLLIADMKLTTIKTIDITDKEAIKGMNHRGLLPVKILSKKILEYPDSMIPDMAIITDVITENAIACPVPSNLSLIKEDILKGEPEGSKSSEGSNIRTTPVKPSSNLSMDIVIRPLAGSLT